MNALLSFCLRNRITVLIITAALTLLSLFVVTQLPVDVFPELKVPRVTIQTEAGGLSAEEVEQYVSIPIQSAMSGTTGVERVSSSSGAGLSFVWVDFDWDTDIYLARQIVSERLATVRSSLPAEVECELAPIVSVTGEIMLIAITGSEQTDPLDMRRIAEFELRNRLMRLSRRSMTIRSDVIRICSALNLVWSCATGTPIMSRPVLPRHTPPVGTFP